MGKGKIRGSGDALLQVGLKDRMQWGKSKCVSADICIACNECTSRLSACQRGKAYPSRAAIGYTHIAGANNKKNQSP